MIDTSTKERAGERITIPVHGMTCAACQGRVQRALEKTAGVREANVNLMMHNATVEFDPSVTSTERLVDAIRATGYEAQVPPAAVAPSEARWAAAFAEQEAQERARGDELRELAWKAGVSLALGIVAMLISMPVMAAYAQAVPMSTADPFCTG